MIHKVRVKKSALDYCRKLARNNNKEIQSYLIGKVISPTVTEVVKFAHTKNYHTQTENEVAWYEHEFNEVKQKAEAEGLRIVGDIHSHPNWDAVMSPADYKNHIIEGNRVCGLISTQGKKTRVRFWIAESALPAEIEYTVND